MKPGGDRKLRRIAAPHRPDSLIPSLQIVGIKRFRCDQFDDSLGVAADHLVIFLL